MPNVHALRKYVRGLLDLLRSFQVHGRGEQESYNRKSKHKNPASILIENRQGAPVLSAFAMEIIF